MKKTVLKIEAINQRLLFRTIADIIAKQGNKIDWSKVTATATVDEHEEYPF
jgi:hypothetical protein